ncbi:MAG: recombinase family protein [Candidatus Poseidoniaceae archaeon]|nr:recombinase family protein [Candidatus Poseidoniaceae archaeon]
MSAKVPLWSRPAAKQMKAFILKQKIKHIFAYRMDRLFRSTIDCLATVEELDEFGIGIQFCESGGQPLEQVVHADLVVPPSNNPQQIVWFTPVPLRNICYRIVAKYRYKIFKQPAVCIYPELLP